MSDSTGNGVSIGELPSAVEVGVNDIVPITQGYTGPGTGQTRKATIPQLLGALPSTLAMSIAGAPLPSGQPYQVLVTQGGTLTSVGAAGRVLTNPTATNTLLVKTLNSGTLNVQGTITISTAGSVTFPNFTQTMKAGDAFEIVNQATADASGGNYAFGFPYIV